jgi:hypothetical protein
MPSDSTDVHHGNNYAACFVRYCALQAPVVVARATPAPVVVTKAPVVVTKAPVAPVPVVVVTAVPTLVRY